MKINSLRLILFSIIAVCIPRSMWAMEFDNSREFKSSSIHDELKSANRLSFKEIPTSYYIIAGAITLAVIVATRIALSDSSTKKNDDEIG